MTIRDLSVLAAAILVAGCAQDEKSGELTRAVDEANATVASGENLVSFELADMTGTIRTSAEWDGKPKLLNFWATWCAPCRREIPLLKDTQDAHGDPLGLQVIGIAVDFQEDVVAYAEQAEFNYPILVGQEDAMSVAESSGVEFIGLPFTMVVAPSGELIKTHIGEIVEEHIDAITAVLSEMQQGSLDLDGARERLRSL
jgi:thiol-disulfide isomerase/thioredoxin